MFIGEDTINFWAHNYNNNLFPLVCNIKIHNHLHIKGKKLANNANFEVIMKRRQKKTLTPFNMFHYCIVTTAKTKYKLQPQK